MGAQNALQRAQDRTARDRKSVSGQRGRRQQEMPVRPWNALPPGGRAKPGPIRRWISREKRRVLVTANRQTKSENLLNSTFFVIQVIK